MQENGQQSKTAGVSASITNGRTKQAVPGAFKHTAVTDISLNKYNSPCGWAQGPPLSARLTTWELSWATSS